MTISKMTRDKEGRPVWSARRPGTAPETAEKAKPVRRRKQSPEEVRDVGEGDAVPERSVPAGKEAVDA